MAWSIISSTLDQFQTKISRLESKKSLVSNRLLFSTRKP